MLRVHEQHRLGVVADAHALHVVEAAHEQPGADEQHDRQRALQHEQRRARPRPLIVPSRAPALSARARSPRPDSSAGASPVSSAGDQRRADRHA